MKKNYLYSIENLRGLAILLVFFTHCSSFSQFSPIISEFLRFIVGNATTIFVFISGFLFHYLQSKKKFKYFNFLKQKLKFVGFPYLFFITVATTLGVIFKINESFSLSTLQFYLWSLMVGGSIVGPLWFIPMIGLYFITAPLFLILSKLPYAIFSIITFSIVFLSLFTDRPFNQYNPFLSYIHFFGFYILGVYFSTFSQFRIKLLHNYKMVFFLTISVFISLEILYLYNYNYNINQGFFASLGKFNFIHAGKLCMTVFLFVAFERYINHKTKYLSYFSNISFGIFFVHGFMLLIFSKLMNMFGGISDPILSLILETIIGLGGSVLVIYIGKKILGTRSRYVLGC